MTETEARRVLALCGALATKGRAAPGALTWSALDTLRAAGASAIESAARAHFDEQAAALTDAVALVGLRRGRDLLLETTKRTPDESRLIELLREAFDVGAWFERLRRRLARPVLGAVAIGYDAGALSASYEGVFNPEGEGVERTLRRLLAKQQSVDETTLADLARAILDGLTRGETIGDITERVRAVFDDAKLTRARTVAQTAATTAFESGQMAAFRDAGVVGKRWLSQRDGNVRPSHAAADGQERPLDDAFDVGGAAMQHPGDPAAPAAEVVRCRCSMLPLLRLSAPVKASTPDWVAHLNERDAAIRAAYPALKAKYGREGAFGQIADDLLAKGIVLTPRQVRRIIDEKARA